MSLGLDAPPAPIAPERAPVTDQARFDWLRLARSSRVGPATFIALLRRYADAASAIEALPHLSRRGGRALSPAPEAAIEAEMAAAAEAGAVMLALGTPEYPAALAAIHDPPPLLWVIGDAALMSRDSVGMVGARNASALGLKLAEALARDLSEAGWLVVSGLARGVDAAAHRGALRGGTAAVLGGGVDTIYPAGNADLYAQIAAQGVLLSEAPIGHGARAKDFPRRNRIIAGLSRAVVVVEAAERSGSLITARMAGEQGREVMAAPGSPLDGRAGGCNLLIREGATLIRHAGDILEALQHRSAFLAPEAPPLTPVDEAPDDLRERVIAALGPAPTPIDDLSRVSGGAPGEVALVLLELELAGRLIREPGGRVVLTP